MKNILKYITGLVLIGLFFLGNSTMAQERGLIRGKVTDSRDKSDIIGATVIEIDKDERIITGVTTDMNGNYALRVSNINNRLRVSFIGYKTITQNINNRVTINIQLEEDITTLSGVEIIAESMANSGMLDMAKRDLTTSVSSISAKGLEELQATSIDQALQGRIAGVDIVANSGDPGAGMSIRIRGTSSINSSSDPMIIVDGMPYQTDIASDFDFATADEQGYAQLLNISPSDILEISVLKDAAATALWGSRAANGVLVITTKRGIVGKPRINYTFKGTVRDQPTSIPMLTGDQYSMLIPEMVMNRNGVPLRTSDAKEFLYDPNDSYWYYNYGNNTNWVDAITRTGYELDHSFSVSGGGEKARYRASIGYNGQQGITKGTDFSRISARINLDFNVSSKIRFQTDLAYTHVDNNRNYVNNKDSEDGVRAIAYRKMPNMSLFEYDEYGNLTPNYFSPTSNIQGSYSRTYNPLAMAETGKNRVLGDRIIPKFRLQYDILPALIYTFDVQFDINNSKNMKFLPQIATGRPWTETVVNRADDSDLDKLTVNSINKLIYTPNIGEKHSLLALLSFETLDYKEVGFGVTTSNSPSSELQDPSVPSRITNNELNLSSGSSQNRSIGALVNVQYGLLDRYIINVGVRRDGNSKFGVNNRYGTFPTISTRWRISGEPFMQNVKLINDLSVRLSYGEAGNAPKASYGHFNTYGTYSWNYLGIAGVYPQNMELKDLKWETVSQSNLGFNLQMLDRRVNVDIDIYKKRTKDMFYRGLDISSISGFTKVDMNVGVMDNQGWELSVFTTPYRSNDWKVDFNFNISQNLNMIREISEYYPRNRGNLTSNGQYLITIQENNPLGSFYGYRYTGVYSDMESTVAKDKNGNPIVNANGEPVYMRFFYPVVDYTFQPGDAMYEDINNDGNINYMDVVWLGDANPRYTGGFGPTIQYKSWRVTTFFNFRYGCDVVNATKMNTENMYGFDNQSTAVLRRWRNPGDVTDIPRATYNSGFNWLGSDRYVEDGSFVRFKYVTVRYNFKPEILNKINFREMSFYVTAENLYTFTKYTGQDPEVTLKSNEPFRLGFDNSMTPPTRTITVGISVGL